MSSAMMSSGRPDCATCSSSGIMSLTVDVIFFSWIEDQRVLEDALHLAGSVMKCGDRKPLSNCMPSTHSTSVSMPCGRPRR